jgi:hypothetical protein
LLDLWLSGVALSLERQAGSNGTPFSANQLPEQKQGSFLQVPRRPVQVNQRIAGSCFYPSYPFAVPLRGFMRFWHPPTVVVLGDYWLSTRAEANKETPNNKLLSNLSPYFFLERPVALFHESHLLSLFQIPRPGSLLKMLAFIFCRNGCASADCITLIMTCDQYTRLRQHYEAAVRHWGHVTLQTNDTGPIGAPVALQVKAKALAERDLAKERVRLHKQTCPICNRVKASDSSR